MRPVQSYSAIMEFLWFFFGKTFLPVLVPILVYQLYKGRKIPRKKLCGKVVLITGASSGLGEAIAQLFYLAGCKVILASRRVKELEKVKSKLMSLKPDAVYIPKILQLDLLDVDSLSMKASEAESMFGQVDILVNNGGVSFRGDILNTSMDVHINVMTVNYFGPLALTKALLPGMIKRGEGHIIGISSVQGQIAIPHRSAYASSKHAFQAFLDCLRSEVAHKNILVTVVSPGYINTSLSKNALTESGSTYGVTDPTTASGYEPKYVAEKVLLAVSQENPEIIVSTLGPKIAIILRVLCPKLYFHIMKNRAKKYQFTY
ncbi:dehydrogenase/reductase SDR family protein 7-like [Cimex lectularius]|uniref:Dehydrogenase n=1 Tax=Cimex lectularius TaxID=79782 RepID=A0A8I6R9B0_CIMLE|nr:dehydrogenase/reductase SDR family protein 7-like [Cimex lectularius]